MSKKIFYFEKQNIGPFNNLYIKETLSKDKHRSATFQCSACSQFFNARITDIKSGKQKSCGCALIECAKNRIIKYVWGQKIGNNGVQYLCDNRFKNGIRYAFLRCSCGKIFIANIQQIKTNWTRGCGCKLKTKDGLSKHPLYIVWSNMMRRCTNKFSIQYKDYGGRGIKVCKQWHNFIVFYEWSINNKYEKGLFIDRINNNKGYTPDNCRFVTRGTNNRNKRCSIKYLKENASDASIRLGGKRNLVSTRINQYGWSKKKAFSTKVIK